MKNKLKEFFSSELRSGQTMSWAKGCITGLSQGHCMAVECCSGGSGGSGWGGDMHKKSHFSF